MKKVKYTAQAFTESWSFANPEGTDIYTADNLRDLYLIFTEWRDEVRRYSNEPVYLLVWKGLHLDVTDLYPDFRLSEGPRGGMIKWESV